MYPEAVFDEDKEPLEPGSPCDGTMNNSICEVSSIIIVTMGLPMVLDVVGFLSST